MSFVEIIGFIISFLALIYLFFKQQSIARYRQEHPEAFKEEEIVEEDPLTELMKAIEKETKAREAARHLPPPLPKAVQKPKPLKAAPLAASLEDYHLESQIEKRRLESQVEKRKLKSSLENRVLKSSLSQRLEEKGVHAIPPSHHPGIEKGLVGPSRAEMALRRLAHRRDLIIYQEIIDKPKSLRS
jgi:hypothetical protein